jgi:hypothetical protein
VLASRVAADRMAVACRVSTRVCVGKGCSSLERAAAAHASSNSRLHLRPQGQQCERQPVSAVFQQDAHGTSSAEHASTRAPSSCHRAWDDAARHRAVFGGEAGRRLTHVQRRRQRWQATAVCHRRGLGRRRRRRHSKSRSALICMPQMSPRRAPQPQRWRRPWTLHSHVTACIVGAVG